ncbi:hypothetical protein DFH09DRAFT_817996, partial [Mycena vulgaris]
GLETITDDGLYCHSVTELVAHRRLCQRIPRLRHASRALQLDGATAADKNITRNFREDVEEHRYFWPRETWA